METAIQRAIKGGYKDHAYCNEFDMYECSTSYCHATVLLDPDFWKALGKAEGWSYKSVPQIFESADQDESYLDYDTIEEWKYQMHNFIDHLIAGKEVDSFFNNLLTN